MIPIILILILWSGSRFSFKGNIGIRIWAPITDLDQNDKTLMLHIHNLNQIYTSDGLLFYGLISLEQDPFYSKDRLRIRVQSNTYIR